MKISNTKMKKLGCLLMLSLLVLQTYAAKLWDLRVSDNQRFVQYTDGTPFFWLGDTGWLLPVALDRSSVKSYLTTCKQNGYNVVQIQTLSGVPSINCYGQMSNISKSNPWDFSNIDKEGVYGYWDHMDYIVEEAERQDIYIAMTCIWGGLVKGGAMDVAGAKAYGEFLARRYAKHPNIIWMIGGDIQGDIKPEVWETLARTIKSIDKRHLMTYHPRGRYTSARWWAKADWIDFHMYQSGHRMYGQRMGNKDYPIPDNTEENCWMYVDSTWAYNPLKPVLDGEPSYEAIPKGLHDADAPQWQASDVRRYAYWDVFAGCFGHTYGNNAIMQMYAPGKAVAYSREAKPWWEAQKDPGYVQMKYLKALMLSLPFFDRVPDQRIVYKDNGERYDRLAATRGEDYLLVYNYTSRPMNVDLTKISGKKKNVWWMDCQTGVLSYLGEYENGKCLFEGDKQTGSAVVNDRVLIAIDAAKDYLSISQKNILVSTEGKKRYEHYSEWMVASEMKRVDKPYYLDFTDVNKRPKGKWSYVMGIELEGMLDTYLTYQNPEVLAYIKQYAEKMIDAEGNITGYNLKDYNLDNIRPGRFIYRMNTLFPECKTPGTEQAVKTLFSQLYGDGRNLGKFVEYKEKDYKEQPRTKDKVWWHKEIYHWQVWLDGIYMGLPFYTMSAEEMVGKKKARKIYDDALNQITTTFNRTYDEKTGLWKHAWDETHLMFWADQATGLSQHTWARAMGWFTMAMVEILDVLPQDYARRDELIGMFGKAMAAVVKYQDKDTGVWYDVLDVEDPRNYLESTASCMFAYCLLKGARLGYLDATYKAAGVRAYDGIIKHFIRENDDQTISLTSCCAVSGLGPEKSPNRDGSFEYYMSEPIRDNDAKGIGPFIWASLEMECYDKE